MDDDRPDYSEYKPANIGAAGERLWHSIADVYTLTPDSLRVLADACKTADVCDRLAAEAVDAPVTTNGYNGQPVENPVFVSWRQFQQLLVRQLGSLKLPVLPDEDEDEEYHVDDGRPRKPMSRQDSARKAAQARWHGVA